MQFVRSSLRFAASPSSSHASPASAVFAARLKKSTNITGIPVSPAPLSELQDKYTKTLAVLASLPPSSVYRQATTALTQQRLDIVSKAKSQADAVKSDAARVEKVYKQAENELDAGQLEQVIEQAQAELSLAAKMNDWKAYVSPPPIPHPHRERRSINVAGID